MKLTLTIVLVTALVLQRANAAPHPFDFGDVLRDLTSIPKLAFDGLNQFAQDSFKFAETFANTVRQDSNRLLKEGEKLAHDLGERMNELVKANVDNFQAFVGTFNRNLSIRIGGVQNKVKQNALKNVKDQFEKVSLGVETLKTISTDIVDKIETDINSNEDRLLADWNEFASVELSNVASKTDDKAANDRAEQMVNSFINRYGTFIDACGEEFQLTAEKYKANINTVIEENQAVVETLRNQLDACLANDNSRRSVTKCQVDVKKELPKLTNLTNELDELNKQGKKLLEKGFRRRTCVITTLTEFELEKKYIRQQLQEITNGNEDEQIVPNTERTT